MSEPVPLPPADRPEPGPWLRYLLLAALGVGMLAALALALSGKVSFPSALEQYESLRHAAAVRPVVAWLVFAVAYALAVAAALPGAMFFTLFGGLVLGWAPGAAGGIAGSVLGGMLVHAIVGSSLGRSRFTSSSPRFQRFAEAMRRRAFGTILFLRLLPVFPYVVINIAAGLVRVPRTTFAVATLIGIAPIAFSMAFIGSGLGTAVERELAPFNACKARGQSDCRVVFDPAAFVSTELFAGLSLLAVLAVVPLIFRRRIARLRPTARPDSER
jgi:uncharacterized membrane protein YdjX (TVP38/TMEM64 family)